MSILDHDYSEISQQTDICTAKSLHRYNDGVVSWKIVHKQLSNDIYDLFAERRATRLNCS